jgi:hypothetical protein
MFVLSPQSALHDRSRTPDHTMGTRKRLDKNPQAMRVRRETAEHPFGTLKMRMGASTS